MVANEVLLEHREIGGYDFARDISGTHRDLGSFFDAILLDSA
jgi:hypothetical protein